MENVPGKERDRIEQMCNQTRGGRKDSKRASENAVAHARENLKGGEGERKPVSVRAWEWNLRGKTERQRNERLCESAFYRATECVRERETHTREVKPVEQTLLSAAVPKKKREVRENK